MKEMPMDSKNYDVSLDYLWRDTRTSRYNNCEAGDAPVTDNKGRAMMVKDLISELEKLNPSAPIVIKDKNGLKVGADITVQDLGMAVFLVGNDLSYPDPRKIEDCIWMIDYEVKALMDYAQQLRKKLCDNEPV